MPTTLRAIYSDKRGSENILISNTGISSVEGAMKTTIRGVVFTGNRFDALAPAQPSELFDLAQGDLNNCLFTVHFPIRLQTPDGLRLVEIVAVIKVEIPSRSTYPDTTDVKTYLVQPEFSIASRGASGCIESELLSLESQLPPGFHLQMCLTCGLSDYSPAGQQTFGNLACFRDVVEEYYKVHSKADIFALWKRLTEYVQETHYCTAYELRPKDRGYRSL
jgi:hypothetical protein